ncbi:MAG: DUF1822 family protein [Cyanobacteria bacterium J06639_14]
MGKPLETIRSRGIPLPITENARCTAQEFAQAQPTPEKANQVLMNSLAVWVTNDYCQMMGIPTDLEDSDSWNPITQMMANVADLSLTEVGQLECRPIVPDTDRCLIPPEVWDLRVGYVVVEIDASLQMAQLLGFTPTVAEETFPLAQLQPLENLLDHVAALKQAIAPLSSDPITATPLGTIVHLNQWFNAIFETGWQAVETLLTPAGMTPAMGFRGTSTATDADPEPPSDDRSDRIRRAKLIDLVVQIGTQQVILLIELQVESPNRIHISSQVHPPHGHLFLPPELELLVLEPSDTIFMQAQSRQADNYIQLQFIGKPGEHFKVQLNLDDASYTEEFVV